MDVSDIFLLGPLYTDFDCRFPGTLDVLVQRTDQCDFHPTIYSSSCHIVGLIPLHCEADGCAFQRSLRLHVKDAVHRDNKRGLSYGASGFKALGTSDFFSFHSSGGTSKVTFSGERGVQYSLHACREYCLSISDRGRRSVDTPSARNYPWIRVDCWVVTLLAGTCPTTWCKLYG